MTPPTTNNKGPLKLPRLKIISPTGIRCRGRNPHTLLSLPPSHWKRPRILGIIGISLPLQPRRCRTCTEKRDRLSVLRRQGFSRSSFSIRKVFLASLMLRWWLWWGLKKKKVGTPAPCLNQVVSQHPQTQTHLIFFWGPPRTRWSGM